MVASPPERDITSPAAPPRPGAAGQRRRYRRIGVAVTALAGTAAAIVAVAVWGGFEPLHRNGPLIAADPVARFLLAVTVVVLVCHLLAARLERWGQPPVVGEILGGLLLGPSLLGLVWPSAQSWLFPPEVLTALQMAAQLGLIALMYLVGSELHVTDRGAHGRAVGFVVVGAMGLPFVAGVAIAWPFAHLLAGSAGPGGTGVGDVPAYALFFGLAISITALPVLARILRSLRLAGTPLGGLALTSAAVGDGVAWLVLTAVLTATSRGSAGNLVATVALVVVLGLVTVFGLRPALAAVVRRLERHPHGDQLLLPILAAGAIGLATTTQFIGLHPVIGAFLFGAITPRGSAAIERANQRLQGYAITILLPLFFAGVGLTVSIGLLGDSVARWSLFAGVLVVAIAAKFLGASLGARLAGLSGRESLQLGALMNCRGVTEVVVASIGLQHQLINRVGFTILVLLALITTAATTPLLRAFGTGR